jgi:hypothetical protein
MSKTHPPKTSQNEKTELPLSRGLRVDDIEDGEDYATEASQGEREAIAKLLDLVGLEALRFHGKFHFGGEGRLLLEGTLSARMTQTCVVSLDPVETTHDVPVAAEFWPQARIDALAATADEAASHGILDWPEPVIDGRIELGGLLYETLATGLDPYPRRAGASFEWTESPDEAASATAPGSPFAALSRLRGR